MVRKSFTRTLPISFVFAFLTSLGSVQATTTELVSPNEEALGHFGWSVSGVSDVNGDGGGDVIIGARYEDPDPSPDDAGRAYIIFSFQTNINVSPSSLAFGSQDIDSGPTGNMIATITNDGSAVLTFTGAGIEITGANAFEFTITNSPSTSSLATGATREIEVAFDPTSTGAKTANLTITSDACNKATVNVPLSGTGFEDTPTPTHTPTFIPTETPTPSFPLTFTPTPTPDVSLGVQDWELF